METKQVFRWKGRDNDLPSSDFLVKEEIREDYWFDNTNSDQNRRYCGRANDRVVEPAILGSLLEEQSPGVFRESGSRKQIGPLAAQTALGSRAQYALLVNCNNEYSIIVCSYCNRLITAVLLRIVSNCLTITWSLYIN